jgi:hypothetical protein
MTVRLQTSETAAERPARAPLETLSAKRIFIMTTPQDLLASCSL